MDELLGEPEDEDDFPSFSHQDIGKLKCSLLTVDGLWIIQKTPSYVEKSHLLKTAKAALHNVDHKVPDQQQWQIQCLLEIQSTALSKKEQ